MFFNYISYGDVLINDSKTNNEGWIVAFIYHVYIDLLTNYLFDLSVNRNIVDGEKPLLLNFIGKVSRIPNDQNFIYVWLT